MDGSITWVGMDAHKKALVVAVLHSGEAEPEEFTIDNEERSVPGVQRHVKAR
jgi:hypothetical protein